MEKFSVNYGTLETELRPKTPVFKYEDVKHRLRKVSFDVVRFVDTDNIDGLWQIQQTDDGEVIVAMYDESSLAEKSSTDWNAIADKLGNINIFYKNSPVTKISLASAGMADEDADHICEVLSDKLGSNKALLNGLLAKMTTAERDEVLKAHPELKVK